MANPVWQSAQVGSDSGNTLTITKPTSTAQHDLLVAHIVVFSSSTGTTPPSGWTQIGSNASGSFAYYKIAGASEPTSYAFTTSGATTQNGAIHRITGASTSSWAINAFAQATNSGSANTVTLSSGITPLATNTLLLSFMGQIANATMPQNVAITNNNPSWTTGVSAGNSLFDQYGNYAPASTTGSATATWANTEAANQFGFHLIAIASPQVQSLVTGTFSVLAPVLNIGKLIGLFGAVFSVFTPTFITNTIWSRSQKSSSATWTRQNKSIL